VVAFEYDIIGIDCNLLYTVLSMTIGAPPENHNSLFSLGVCQQNRIHDYTFTLSIIINTNLIMYSS